MQYVSFKDWLFSTPYIFLVHLICCLDQKFTPFTAEEHSMVKDMPQSVYLFTRWRAPHGFQDLAIMRKAAYAHPCTTNVYLTALLPDDIDTIQWGRPESIFKGLKCLIKRICQHSHQVHRGGMPTSWPKTKMRGGVWQYVYVHMQGAVKSRAGDGRGFPCPFHKGRKLSVWSFHWTTLLFTFVIAQRLNPSIHSKSGNVW